MTTRTKYAVIGAVVGAIIGFLPGFGGSVLGILAGGGLGYVAGRDGRFALVFVVGLMGCFGTRVDETEFCTETRWGNAITPIMKTGWNWQISPGLGSTCFPASQQLYPGGRDEKGQPIGDVVVALTTDSVDLTLEFAFEYEIPRAVYYDSVFKKKREPEAFLQTVANVAREGARLPVTRFRSGSALSERDRFGDSLKVSLQRSAGGLFNVTRVYVRDMDLPQKVRDARELVFQQNMELDRALKQRRIDSVGNVTKIQNAQTDYEVRSQQAKVFENKVFADIEVKKAQAKAMGDLCGQAQTCIIGGTVMDKWMAGGR